MDDDLAQENPAAPEAQVPWESIDGGEDESEPGDPTASDEARSDLAFEATAPGNVPDEDAEDPMPPAPAYSPSRGGGWTLPILCAGIALVACCALIPQADANRRLAYERQTLQADLDSVEKQIAVNASFLKEVGRDPTLAERLAQRQMKVIAQGTRLLDLPPEAGGSSMSPFQLVNVAPPPARAPYRPIGGFIARICYDAHSRLYLMGIALGMIATGLVLGSAPEP